TRPRLRDVPHGRALAAPARSRPPVLLPLHRPGEPDLEHDLRADRLRPRLRVEGGSVRAPLGELPAPQRPHRHRAVRPRAPEQTAEHALRIGPAIDWLKPRLGPSPRPTGAGPARPRTTLEAREQEREAVRARR